MNANKYLIQLDGLRALAISAVIVAHYTTIFPKPTGEKFNYFVGAFGVTLFFVLSGFLIIKILIDNKESAQSNAFILRQFYIRRFLRIFPLYYLAILIGWILDVPNCREHVVSLLTYVANWVPGPPRADLRYYSHLWSLGVEEQFYIFFPVVFLWIKKEHTKRFLIGLIAFAFISRIAVVLWHAYTGSSTQNNWMAHRLTPCCLDAFAIGGLLAFAQYYYYAKAKAFFTKRNWTLPVLALLAGSVLLWMTDTFEGPVSYINIMFNRPLLATASVFLVGKAAFSGYHGIQKKLLENKVIVYIGKISYGLYVYHFIIPYLIQLITPAMPAWLAHMDPKILSTIGSVAIASLSWFVFEKPINDLKKYFTYQKQQPTITPTPDQHLNRAA